MLESVLSAVDASDVVIEEDSRGVGFEKGDTVETEKIEIKVNDRLEFFILHNLKSYYNII